ncbi:heterokaryon incompatibility protein-domain-containing protein [Pisolithus tinctorius]|nr:heterokaryon incompatibility protein-domain-containing protein [Pisolithus tinctorius]
MKLLDVKAVLDREKDIQMTDPKREILKELDDKDTRYAILSHRWGVEVGYEEMTGLMKMGEEQREEVRERYGYQKIIKSCEQAMKDGYEWLWVDTCCIDKRSSSELSEAINSMYRWYRNAQVCYAYLNDVDEEVFPVKQDGKKFDKSNGWPEWFVRGWTLQELIAPRQVEFFNRDWVSIGNKRRLALALEEITKIPPKVVRDGLAAKRPSVAQIMSWAADRKTTRVEDRAYSLMGLFGVNMPMLYGEGEKAFQRLQLEIIRTSSDHTIFAWDPQSPRTGSVLAEDPSDFRGCGNTRKVEPGEFVDSLARYICGSRLGDPWYINVQSDSRKTSTNPVHWGRLAWLRWRARSLSQPLRTFSVSNAGIQVCLPVIPSPNSPSHFSALLACSDRTFLERIDLVFSGSSFDRTSRTTDIPTAYPEFKTLYLTHSQDANETHREFTLDDKHASYHGFTRRGTFPRKFPGDTVTLSSLTDDLIVIVYANDDVKSRFAVGLGYYLGQGWVHVVYDDQEADWTAFAKNAHARMWKARAKHARSMPKHVDYRRDSWPVVDHFIKHAHLPRSIWGVMVVWGRWKMDDFDIMVDVEQCPGCCDGPCKWEMTRALEHDLDTPGLMLAGCHQHCYKLDGWLTGLDGCSGQRVALGDYGDYSDGNFKCAGNIFEDMRTLDNDPTSSVYRPVVSRVAETGRMKQDDGIVRYIHNNDCLVLRQPKGLSLPTNESVVLLLKALSHRAAGKHLVITVIQCSDFYRAGDEGKRTDSGDALASDSGNHSTEPQVLTLLYAAASPQVWRRKPFFEERRKQFQSIREHFYSLMNMDQFRRPEARRKSLNKQNTDRTIKFFSDIFGLPYLRNYVGKITFFERLSSMMETNSRNEVSVGNVEAHGLLADLFRGTGRSNATLDPRLEIVLPLWRERCPILVWPDASRRYASEKQKVTHELESISRTPSAGLLKCIGIALSDPNREHDFSWAGPASDIEYDRSVLYIQTFSNPHLKRYM